MHLFLAPPGTRPDETRRGDSSNPRICTFGNAPAPLQATPTGRPSVAAAVAAVAARFFRGPKAQTVGPSHDSPAQTSSDFEILQRTPARPHTRTPASLSKSVPHNESAQATLPPWALAVPKTPIIITVVSRWYYFYICLPPPLKPCATSAQPFAIVPSLSVLILSPPRPPGILSRASMLRNS